MKLHNGFYTIQNVTTGEHRTFRVKTSKSGPLKGKRIVGLLTGPDNTSSYEGFAFATDTGIIVWQKKRGKEEDEKGNRIFSNFEYFADMLWKLSTATTSRYHGKYSIRIEKHCLRCNRQLTHPESLDTGYGPECVKTLTRAIG